MNASSAKSGLDIGLSICLTACMLVVGEEGTVVDAKTSTVVIIFNGLAVFALEWGKQPNIERL